jgi:hypothetical protein
MKPKLQPWLKGDGENMTWYCPTAGYMPLTPEHAATLIKQLARYLAEMAGER